MLEIRPPTLEDAAGAAELFNARSLADFGDAQATPERVRAWWSEALDDLTRHAWLALDDGRVVGYARLIHSGEVGEVHDESCTHPEFEGRGVASALLDRADELACRDGFVRSRATAVNDAGRALLRARGYELVRHFWRMEIDLDAEPPPAEPPPGFALRGYRPGEDDAAVHACHQEAFADDWGNVPRPLETWLAHRTRRSDYDPRGWVLAVAGDEIAGGSLAFPEDGLAWVLDVFVVEPVRGRGLGLALLRETFARLWPLGVRHVGLEVDAANETGATRLYERAGMRVTRRYDVYEKPLR